MKGEEEKIEELSEELFPTDNFIMPEDLSVMLSNREDKMKRYERVYISPTKKMS
jgi:hypothetical protein